MADAELRVVPEREPRVPDGRTRAPHRSAHHVRRPTRCRTRTEPERLAGLAADPRAVSRPGADASARSLSLPTPPPPVAPRSVEPRRPPPVQALSETEEQNLAEMAQQLESALQRQRLAAAPPTVAAAAGGGQTGDGGKRESRTPETKAETKPEMKTEAKPAAAPQAAGPRSP